jgi:histidine ammonia-lyase
VQDVGVYIQSAYSLRCIPQILGPVLDTFAFCRRIVEQELNSSNDNPLIFDNVEDTFHGGNFHGQYLAMASDYIGIALGEIGVLVERQINRLVDPHLNGDLPDFLAWNDSGLSSGLSGTQYLATSIASENLDLVAPASVKSLASNAGNQDVVSMSLNSRRKALRLVDNVASILAVFGACLFQAGSSVGVERLSEAGRKWHQLLGKSVSTYDDEFLVQRMVDAVPSCLHRPYEGPQRHEVCSGCERPQGGDQRWRGRSSGAAGQRQAHRSRHRAAVPVFLGDPARLGTQDPEDH